MHIKIEILGVVLQSGTEIVSYVRKIGHGVRIVCKEIEHVLTSIGPELHTEPPVEPYRLFQGSTHMPP